jgi:hypothetical protein
MEFLTLSIRDDYWHLTSEASGALQNVLRLSVAREDDDKDDEDDGYWHP